jgi:Ca2+-binding RTX toxin-like protein
MPMRRQVVVLPIALAVLGVAGGTARAQEAPICTTMKERLDDGRNVLRGGNGVQDAIGLRGKDKMLGGGGADRLNGGRDNDVVKGGPGRDLLCGGRGGDRILGGPGDDLIYGEEENDRIIPGSGDDQVLGSAGNDHIFGWGKQGDTYTDDGTDQLVGGYHDDVIEAGGIDSLDGHTHADVLSTRTPSIAPTVMNGGGNDDTIYGSDQPDQLVGFEGKDQIFGGLGDDHILGEGNDDALFGQLGDDRINGGKGFDELNGGDGTDACDGGEDDLPRDTFDASCETSENRPRPPAGTALRARSKGAKSRIRITGLSPNGAAGRVTSSRPSCAGPGRRISLFTYVAFVSDKLAITHTRRSGSWRIDQPLGPGRYFAKVEHSRGCRFDVSTHRVLR